MLVAGYILLLAAMYRSQGASGLDAGVRWSEVDLRNLLDPFPWTSTRMMSLKIWRKP
jgi:hypothetical protein